MVSSVHVLTSNCYSTKMNIFGIYNRVWYYFSLMYICLIAKYIYSTNYFRVKKYTICVKHKTLIINSAPNITYNQLPFFCHLAYNFYIWRLDVLHWLNLTMTTVVDSRILLDLTYKSTHIHTLSTQGLDLGIYFIVVLFPHHTGLTNIFQATYIVWISLLAKSDTFLMVLLHYEPYIWIVITSEMYQRMTICDWSTAITYKLLLYIKSNLAI